ncbi:MAG: PAS domain S-box protein, partial [Syntrophales bacterium LBB04]|nr:PAS domain S-box protein [Syntrophales bacterium LBB04]
LNVWNTFRAFSLSILDITESKRAEKALRESEQKLRAVLDATPFPVAVVDLQDDKIYFWSRSAHSLFGHTAPTASEWYQIAYPDPNYRLEVIDRWKPFLEIARQLPQAVNTGEYRVTCKDGSVRICELYAAFLPDNLIVTFNDITERKQAEETLQDSEGKYKSVLESIEDGYFEVDHTGSFTFFNDSMCRILGYSRDEMMGMNNRQYMDKENARKVFQTFSQVYTTGEPTKVLDWELVKKDGNTCFVETAVSLMRNKEGKPVGFHGIARDVTEHKRAEETQRHLEERLQRAEKMEALGTLAGGVAHDLNNVLGVLVGYSELLMLDTQEGSSLRDHAFNIFQAGQRSTAIIQDLLTLARRGVAVSEILDVNQIISDFLKTPEFDKLKSYHPKVTFRMELASDLLNIKGSPMHLNKTVMNLLSNGAEAVSDLGEVVIRTENRYIDKPIPGYEETREGEYVLLMVSDTGSGIPQADLRRIFEPFFTKKAMGRSGTGLGLAVAWGTVKDHNGYIDVQSEEGKGSTFYLYFPVTREVLMEELKSPPRSDYLGQGESILVVDDVKEQRSLAATMLGSLGYKVDTVASGDEAVEYLKNQPMDLLVLDMIMDPGIDGLETYGRILEIRPGQRAIIVSGFSETDRVRKAQALGAGPYVRKPYVLEKIGLAVRRELDK